MGDDALGDSLETGDGAPGDADERGDVDVEALRPAGEGRSMPGLFNPARPLRQTSTCFYAIDFSALCTGEGRSMAGLLNPATRWSTILSSDVNLLSCN